MKSFIESTNYPQLARAVIRQLGGWDEAQLSLVDISNHGIAGGFYGFTYYCDTMTFFCRNRELIIDAANDLAGALGENFLDMIAGFRCLNGDYSTVDVARVMFGRWENEPKDCDAQAQVANALAWFAAEEVAHSFANWKDDIDA